MKADKPNTIVERCTINSDTGKAALIADQNDRFRRELLCPDKTIPGHVALTRDVRARGPDFVMAAKLAVASYIFATPDDPHSERDFGTFEILDERLFWQIDLGDSELSQWMTDRT